MRQETCIVHGREILRRQLTDWTEFIDVAERVRRGANGETFGGLRCESLCRSAYHTKWTQTNSLDQAIDFARKGWPPGRFQVDELCKEVDITRLLPHGYQPDPRYDVDGDEPDIARFLASEPEHMRAMPYHHGSNGKLLRLVVQVSYPFFTSAQQVLLRGVAVSLAVDTARLLGYTLEVELVATACCPQWSMKQIETYIPLLHAGNYVNVDTLAFMLVHPSVFRRLVFAQWECEEESIRKEFGFHEGDNYSIPGNAVTLPACDYYIDQQFRCPSTLEEALRLAGNILKAAGIEIRDF